MIPSVLFLLMASLVAGVLFVRQMKQLSQKEDAPTTPDSGDNEQSKFVVREGFSPGTELLGDPLPELVLVRQPRHEPPVIKKDPAMAMWRKYGFSGDFSRRERRARREKFRVALRSGDWKFYQRANDAGLC